MGRGDLLDVSVNAVMCLSADRGCHDCLRFKLGRMRVARCRLWVTAEGVASELFDLVGDRIFLGDVVDDRKKGVHGERCSAQWSMASW